MARRRRACFDPWKVYVYKGKGRIPRNVWQVEVHCSVKFIRDRLFKGCDQLESVLLHDGLLGIGVEAFEGCSSMRSFRCPSSVTKIGKGAFRGCKSLVTSEFPQDLEEIEAFTFSNCTSLEEMRIPASVTRIGDYAFSCCRNLASVGLCEGLQKIGNCAFFMCRFGSIHIPRSVDEIGEKAFCACFSLTSVRLYESLSRIKSYTFEGCPLENVEFAGLSERAEALHLDEQTESMFAVKLNEIAAAMARADGDDDWMGDRFFDWEECKESLRRAHDVLTYWELKGATTTLELALWRNRIEEEGEGRAGVFNNDQRGQHLGVETRGGKRRRQARTREELRSVCGANAVIPQVLKFFTYSTTWS